VTVVDRLPVAGGVLGYEHPSVRCLLQACAERTELVLGTTALRWKDRHLAVAGPGGLRRIRGQHLVYAGGMRPSTPAELRIVGGRLAGVLPAPVAIHLLEAGVRVGSRVVVLGEGHWAVTAVQALEHQGESTVIAVADGQPPLSLNGIQVWEGWKPVRLCGRSRVDAIVLASQRAEKQLACDCVILAAGERPLRNVEGAIFPGAAGVTYVQPPAASRNVDEIEAEARALARAVPLD
jgi:hypothetical protein